LNAVHLRGCFQLDIFCHRLGEAVLGVALVVFHASVRLHCPLRKHRYRSACSNAVREMEEQVVDVATHFEPLWPQLIIRILEVAEEQLRNLLYMLYLFFAKFPLSGLNA